MRTYRIEEQTLLTKYGEHTAKYQVVLNNTIYILAEDWLDIARGAVFIWNKRMGIYQIWRGGLFDAIRATKHVQAGYGLADGQHDEFGEINQLTLARVTLGMLLRQIWDYGNLTDRQRAEYAEDCIALAEELGLVRDEDKAKARDRIALAISVIDSLGRYNPPSRAPMLWSSADLLKYRQETIRFIAKWVDVRQFALLTMLDEIYETVNFAYHQIDKLTLQDEQGRGGRHQIIQIEDLVERLQVPIVLPFRHGFARTATDLDSVRVLLSREQLSPAENRQIGRLYDRSQRAMALYMIRRDLEPIIWGLTSELARRKANRRPKVLDQAMRELAAFTDYISSIQSFDLAFRNPVLPRMYRHLRAVTHSYTHDDWSGVRKHLRRATVMF